VRGGRVVREFPLLEEELIMKLCTKSLLTMALGLGLQSAAFAQAAPSQNAKPKTKVEAPATSQPTAASHKSVTDKSTATKVVEKSERPSDKTNVAAKSVSKSKKPVMSPEPSKSAK
jgi:hypothetical protein